MKKYCKKLKKINITKRNITKILQQYYFFVTNNKFIDFDQKML